MTSQIKLESYVNKVLKQVHPDTGITALAKQEVEALLNLIAAKVIGNINLLLAQGTRVTTNSRDVQSGVRMALPGELAKHAVSEGTKAVTKFNASLVPSNGVKEHRSNASRAGLTFPPSRIKKEIRKLSIAKRTGTSTGVYLAAVLEYLCAEILELAGNSSRDNKRVRIKINDIRLVLENDEEFGKLFKNALLPGKLVGTELAPSRLVGK